jgi:hypothetical protein
MNRVNKPDPSTSVSTPIAEPMAAPGYRQHGGREGLEYDDGGYSSDGSYCTWSDASEVDALRARAQVVLESEGGLAFTDTGIGMQRTATPAAIAVPSPPPRPLPLTHILMSRPLLVAACACAYARQEER